MSKSSTESITLYRQPLPQAPVVHTVLSQPNIPGSAVEYVRINYFSSDATAEVMKVCCTLEPTAPPHTHAHTHNVAAGTSAGHNSDTYCSFYVPRSSA